MTKRESDARCAYAACKCAQGAVLSVHEVLPRDGGMACSELLCCAESALGRLLLMLNNRIMEETEKRRKG